MKLAARFSTVLLVFFAGCASSPKGPDQGAPKAFSDTPLHALYGAKVIHLEVPNRLSDLQMRQAIQNAAIEEGWQIVENGTVDGLGIVALYKKTVFAESTFTFLFGPGIFDGYSDSYTLDVTGKRTRRYTPPARIESIRKSIRENLTAQLAGY